MSKRRLRRLLSIMPERLRMAAAMRDEWPE
jgi:hypothetical protein